MRISTNQFYQSNTDNIINRQSDVNQSIVSISEGKRVITAGDDSVAAISILNIRQEQALTEQYQTNITFAESRITVQESAMQSAEDVMFRVKDLMLQGNSVANDQSARDALADELEARFDELLSLANTRDESGSYVFGGFQTETPPFIEQSDSSVNYVGDKGQRLTNVGLGVQVATSDPGEDVFMTVANSVGDFKPAYTLNPAHEEIDRAVVTRSEIVDRASYVPVATPDDYQISFATMPSGEMGVTVTDALGTQVYPTLPLTQAVYVAGDSISFSGIETEINQTPQEGDSITLSPQSETDVFSVMNDAIDWLRASNGTGADEGARQQDYGHIIADMDEIQIKFSNVRAEIGARLQLTESQSERHIDYNLTIEKSRSSLEDLDMVEAISQFERQKLSLQASQTAFSQVQSMSLLNFL
ncbi:flagellar hook-associated protein FlgL [Psychrobium sp. 1_MG-2023]|uniref:flagellar hook-associated protein FlgL n=1 Tax=Psychrobium sp. 1_MG-2023 TaxID=3062624 RepID=UPI000C34A521|nr:flagellar hook-associated protein FlgL [Psychrobium sp. 1_MG-2023]MDP2559863.1 flagellar hook-associated protein FlgL [Psychrobium sp. 1_MG-2023]PKF59035.1 flagellar hook-associated protein 3 [Alteromonadales bacterium alter-6D02]